MPNPQSPSAASSATSLTRRHFIRAAAGSGLAALAGIRTASAAEGRRPPNILLVFPDQMRADWNSHTPGLPVRTPHLAALASEGTRFGRAYCPSPLCAPSRACLAQGRRYGRTGVLSNHDDTPDGAETFYQLLRDAGYRTASLGKADLRKAAFDWGPDGLHRVGARVYFREWGFTDGFDSEGKMAVVNGVNRQRKKNGPLHPYARMLQERGDGSLQTYLSWYADWMASHVEDHNYGHTGPCELPEAAYNDNWVGQKAVELIRDGFPRDQPWFLQVNFPGPHDPEDITSAMAAWYRHASFPQPIGNTQLPPAVHGAIRRNYSAMVENIDGWLGKLRQAVEQRGELDRTVIVFSSDHGEMLGDHNCWGKSVPFQSAVSVPLVARGPGIVGNRVYDGVTATLDLSATFLDFAGVPIPSDMDSRSLCPVLAGRAGTPQVVTSALGEWRMACDGRYKLVAGIDLKAAHGYGGGAEPGEPGGPKAVRSGAIALFDLDEDPGETRNIAEREPEITGHLRSRLPEPVRPPSRAT